MSSTSTRSMEVCVRLYYVCALLFVSRGLAMGYFPSSDSYRLSIKVIKHYATKEYGGVDV
jgi:hypothetical protein